MSENSDKLCQCLWLTGLTRQTGIHANVVHQILTRWPDLASLMAVSPLDLADIVRGPPEKISRMLTLLRDAHWRKKLEEQAVDAERKGIWAMFCRDEGFPARLKEISCCPLVLYCRGERYAEIFRQPFFVTVIGTRNPTAYGRVVAERITAELAESRVVIISGMARGIDAIAHCTALKHQGLTIAVVGNGPDLPYPLENASLMKEIAVSGLIISEHPPGTAPRKQHFPARNRILSGLADAVAVIEASRESGTLITASFAGDQGRDVYAVPGSILSPFSQGCNQLIRDGAEILESAADILWRLPVGSLQAGMEQWLRQKLTEDGETASAHDLSDAASASRLRHILAGGPLTLAEIAAALDRNVADTAVLLTMNELNGGLSCERGRYSLTEQTFFCI